MTQVVDETQFYQFCVWRKCYWFSVMLPSVHVNYCLLYKNEGRFLNIGHGYQIAVGRYNVYTVFLASQRYWVGQYWKKNTEINHTLNKIILSLIWQDPFLFTGLLYGSILRLYKLAVAEWLMSTMLGKIDNLYVYIGQFQEKNRTYKALLFWIVKMQRHLSSELYNKAQIKKWKDFENLKITFSACCSQFLFILNPIHIFSMLA